MEIWKQKSSFDQLHLWIIDESLWIYSFALEHVPDSCIGSK